MAELQVRDSIEEVPESYSVGQELDWDAEQAPVTLFVELPFWLLVADCRIQIRCGDGMLPVDIRDTFDEVHLGSLTESRAGLVHLGPPGEIGSEIREAADKAGMPLVGRPCKTVLRVGSQCNSDVLDALKEDGGRSRVARLYLRDFCAAHLQVVNELIRKYRLATYDPFAYEVSPWDVPFWVVDSGGVGETVVIVDYLNSDRKPVVYERDGTGRAQTLIDLEGLENGLRIEPSPGELELLDAENLMERGDYSGAVRRIATALEAALEGALRTTLATTLPADAVQGELNKTKNNFPGRYRTYRRRSGRKMDRALEEVLWETREMRHAIVHEGYRIPFVERGLAQKAVDTGRWVFNWLENRPDRSGAREREVARRSLGRHFTVFDLDPCAGSVGGLAL